jgi:three-Cys-motif partner protein
MTREVIEHISSWSERKIRIVEKYAKAYATIFASPRQQHFVTSYIDAFSGAGIKKSKERNEVILGSPLAVLSVARSFDEFHFIDIERTKIEVLQTVVGKIEEQIGGKVPPIHFHVNDANDALREVLPSIRFEEYRRALLFLDPYGFDISWEVMELAGRMKTVDVILNFSVEALNRNWLPATSAELTSRQKQRLDFVFGSGWEKDLYKPSPQSDLFQVREEKLPYDRVIESYGMRLVARAGFTYVSEPLLFVNNKSGAPLYYLLLASQKLTAKKIMDAIVSKAEEDR